MHTDNLYERYRCQMQVPGVGLQGQKKLANSHVLLVGAGGLGCPIMLYLCAAGVRRITVVDPDKVESSNLARQVLYYEQDVGCLKVDAAHKRLRDINSNTHVTAVAEEFNRTLAHQLLPQCDLVIDATDNFETRLCIDDVCQSHGIPCILGAVTATQGQVFVLDYASSYPAPTIYRSLFGDISQYKGGSCRIDGVLGVTTGIIGMIQATESIKLLLNLPSTQRWKLISYDLETHQSRVYDLGAPVQLSRPEPKELALEDLSGLIERHKDLQLFDVRSREEHQRGNLGGLCIPLAEISDFNDFGLSGPVVCYCSGGIRSKEAANFLKSKYPEIEIYFMGMKELSNTL